MKDEIIKEILENLRITIESGPKNYQRGTEVTVKLEYNQEVISEDWTTLDIE